MVIGGLMAFCTAGSAAEKKKEISIARGDHTETLRVGTEFIIRLDERFLAELKKQAKGFDGESVLKFQWRKDTNNIPKATKPELRFESVDFTDVASYTLVYWSEAQGESNQLVHVGPDGVTAPIHLGVFDEKTVNPTTGTVSYPLGAFGEPPTGGNVVCGVTFDRWKSYEPFDGPNCTPPSTNYPNPNQHLNLRIDTCSADNGPTMDTAIQIVGNWAPPPVICNDDTVAVCPNNKLSRRTIVLQASRTYRVGIFYKSSTVGTATKVTFTYTYF